ncbi:MAG TPA: hypothetical protein DCW90_09720 [Lachnospiraceae bacterium]|nr:hypothetical protein [Lachnospiraceae bacterium]
MMLHSEDYPIDYPWLTKSEINSLLTDFDEMTFIEACKWQDKLMKIGIFMEYDWIGHRDEWFLATRADAEAEEDYRYSCD